MEIDDGQDKWGDWEAGLDLGERIESDCSDNCFGTSTKFRQLEYNWCRNKQQFIQLVQK